MNTLTPMWRHQAEAVELTAERAAVALFMEQRTGKTRVVLETAARLWRNVKINSLVIVAPNGVHRNWIEVEAPKWLTPLTDGRQMLLTWRSGMTHTKSGAAVLEALLNCKPALAVLAVNVEALDTAALRTYLKTFLTKRRALLVVDESQTIKNPSSKRTKRALELRKLAPFRRVLTGTPNPESPFDLWAQFRFLDPAILPEDYFNFTHRYAEFEQKFVYDPKTDSKREYPELKRYRYLDELAGRIAPHVFRKTRAECVDLPPVTRTVRRFPLGAEAQRTYDRLKSEYVLEMGDGRLVDGRHVLTRMLRLQQVASNMLATSAGQRPCQTCKGGDTACPACLGWGFEPMAAGLDRIAAKCARQDALVAELRETPGQAIVWCRFREDVRQVSFRLTEEFGCAVATLDGDLDAEARAAGIASFQAGAARYVVGNPAVGGRGLDLSAAETTIYFSNYFSLELRLQSEDRMVNLADLRPRGIVDLVAERTVDEQIVRAHGDKKELKDMVMRDPTAEWLQ